MDGARRQSEADAPPLRIRAAGRNDCGQCGVPRQHGPLFLRPADAPGLQPPPGTAVCKICCGASFVLMLTDQGEVLHAGANDCGQLGNGEAHGESHPGLRAVPLPSPAADIACGEKHAVAALSSGAAFTWGFDYHGRLGRGGEGRVPAPAEGITAAAQVFAGVRFTFFLSSGAEVAACGENESGQLCLGNVSFVPRPQRVAALCGRRVVQLQCGEKHCILLEADGSVSVWGELHGYLADGSDVWNARKGTVPTRVKVGPALCVAAGYRCCAVVGADEGSLVLWGPRFFPRPRAQPGSGGVDMVICGAEVVFARFAGGPWAALGTGKYGLPFGSAEEETRLRPLTEGGLAARSVPICGSTSEFALYLEGCDAERVLLRSTGVRALSAVLRVSGRELGERDLDCPLSDLGVSAEAVVHLLRVPPLPPAAGAASPAEKGAALVVFVDASPLGAADAICVELHPEATALDLVAAAAGQLGLCGG
eukprot:TRINITY_DN52250_c0_g1_i1.p2 TRINITY_DN52250_c0_g1~~TRINITY_DN52250_c0_g1_i1.p2  ORF type:complete len:504 (+),score=128.08 TRINITY_DN52250_c0_g1_i1:73-1512(+)